MAPKPNKDLDETLRSTHHENQYSNLHQSLGQITLERKYETPTHTINTSIPIPLFQHNDLHPNPYQILPEIKSSNDSNWGKGVSNAIRNRGESNSEKRESLHSFSSVVDNAIRSENNSDSKPPDNVSSFSWMVDNAIRSENNSHSKKPNIVPSFSLVVDNAIRSGNNSDLIVNKAIWNWDAQAETDAEEADTPNSVNKPIHENDTDMDTETSWTRTQT